MRAKKILLLGAQAVGKTSYARRLRFNAFEHDYKSTIGVQLHELSIEAAGERHPVVLWDTDGNFGEKVFESVYIKGASACFIVADVLRPHTIDHLRHLATHCQRALPGRPVFGLLNKVDLAEPDASLVARAEAAVDELRPCSALTGEGIQEAAGSLISACIRRDSA